MLNSKLRSCILVATCCLLFLPGCGGLTAAQRLGLAKVTALGASGGLALTLADLEKKPEENKTKILIFKAVKSRLDRFNADISQLTAEQKGEIAAAVDRALSPGDDLTFADPVVQASVDLGFTILRGALQVFNAFRPKG